MPQATIISDEARSVTATVHGDGERLLIEPSVLPEALGWELKPSGLCREDTCIPVADIQSLYVDGQLDVAAVATALGRVSVVDAAAGIAAISLPAELRHQAIEGKAPPFTLPDLEGELHHLDEWHGRKKLLVTFASWCGCRYDLPGWQRLDDELANDGFSAIAVAIDNAAEDVRPFTTDITIPVLYDPHHLLTELYAISNVPTVVWIDEEDRIARPNGYAFGTDLFRDFTGVDAQPHLDEVRRWVRNGDLPVSAEEARNAVGDLSNDEVLARLHFRVAASAHGGGDEEVAQRHFDRASELAPHDFTIWRATMPLIGKDPFGDEFFAQYETWEEAGSPYHGLPAVRGTASTPS